MHQDDTKHRICKYLNNIIEADHGALKRVIGPTRGVVVFRYVTPTDWTQTWKRCCMLFSRQLSSILPSACNQLRQESLSFGLFIPMQVLSVPRG